MNKRIRKKKIKQIISHIPVVNLEFGKHSNLANYDDLPKDVQDWINNG